MKVVGAPPFTAKFEVFWKTRVGEVARAHAGKLWACESRGSACCHFLPSSSTVANFPSGSLSYSAVARSSAETIGGATPPGSQPASMSVPVDPTDVVVQPPHPGPLPAGGRFRFNDRIDLFLIRNVLKLGGHVAVHGSKGPIFAQVHQKILASDHYRQMKPRSVPTVKTFQDRMNMMINQRKAEISLNAAEGGVVAGEVGEKEGLLDTIISQINEKSEADATRKTLNHARDVDLKNAMEKAREFTLTHIEPPRKRAKKKSSIGVEVVGETAEMDLIRTLARERSENEKNRLELEARRIAIDERRIAVEEGRMAFEEKRVAAQMETSMKMLQVLDKLIDKLDK